ncbi:VOC family protein [Pelagerythrobacter rhizovicinus]|uniref:Lactoylglutathione lyase n=1 Tax=Pelagerythrobacter rhizovicinus TaxID=2268576 RepID=A0A4V1QWE6_9SPHN|nr:VOC family protein [Pelagerythrobacter rhizovicinus]RXZ65886.1 lactoylglutathione lyase [Pelagerythrobacter rhizovicinus]
MTKMLFVNLPVTDLARSKAFYEAVGFTNNPQFSDDNAVSMVWSDAIYVMLLKHDFWKTFTSKTIPDAHESAQVMLALSQDSQDAVEEIVRKAVAAGGKADPTPKQDLGFMYGRSFEDPDGHIWENAFMDMSALPEGDHPAEQPAS